MVDQENNIQREGEIPQQRPEAGERKETYREKFSRWKNSIREGLGKFGSRRQSAETAIKAVQPEAQFTPDEQQQLDTIEATAQGEVQKTTESLENIEAQVSEAAPEGAVKSAMEKETPKEQNELSLDSILAQAQAGVTQEQQVQAAQEQIKNSEQEDFARRYEQAQREFAEKRQAYERKRKEIQGEILYDELKVGGNAAVQKARQLIEHQKADYIDGQKFDPDIVLGRGGGDRRFWYGEQVKRIDDLLNDPKKLNERVQSELYYARNALRGKTTAAASDYGCIDRQVLNAKEFLGALQERKKRTVEMHARNAWWDHPQRGPVLGRFEELQQYPEEYSKVMKREEESFDEVSQQKEIAFGFGNAALERNDFPIALEAFKSSGQLENVETLTLMNQKVKELAEAKDPKLSQFIEEIKKAKG